MQSGCSVQGFSGHHPQKDTDIWFLRQVRKVILHPAILLFTTFAQVMSTLVSDKVAPIYGDATAGSKAGGFGSQVEDGSGHF